MNNLQIIIGLQKIGGGSIDQRLDMITCKCYKKDISKQMEIYEYLGSVIRKRRNP